MSMGVVDGSFELFWREVVVCLERGDAFPRPIVHQASGVVRAGELMHLNGELAWALEIGSGDVELGSRHLSRVDGPLQFEIGIGVDASAGTSGRAAAGEIEAGGAVTRLSVEVGSTCGPSWRWIKEVLVHADQARDDGLSRHVQDL